MLKGQQYSLEELLALDTTEIWLQGVQQQVFEWVSGKDELVFYTSGSTGKPKKITHKRAHLEASAQRTLAFFGLKPHSTAALVLPAEKIGGAMMLFRALIGGLKLFLYPPKLHPVKTDPVDFLPCTPPQFKHLLSNGGLECFPGTILLGGAAVSPGIDIADLNVYVGYGMTETASHVALRPYTSSRYSAVDGVDFSLKEECLVIHAPHLGVDGLQTTDRAIVHSDKSFELLGRVDHIINSGGLKIQPEKVEAELARHHVIGYVSYVDDLELGQKAIFVALKKITPNLWLKAAETIPSNQRPKEGLVIDQWPMVSQGKIDRNALSIKIRSMKHLLYRLG